MESIFLMCRALNSTSSLKTKINIYTEQKDQDGTSQKPQEKILKSRGEQTGKYRFQK